MAVKAGQVVLLQLGSTFAEPRWREALVVQLDEGWTKTLVRCSTEELEETQLSSVTHNGIPFCLVEAELHQLRLAAPGEVLSLDVDSKALLLLAKAALESEGDLNFATASDPEKLAPKRKGKQKEKVAEPSDSSSGLSSNLGGDDPLTQLRKSWLDSGTRGGRAKETRGKGTNKKKSRFSLLYRKRKSDSSDDKDFELEATNSLLEAAMKSDDPLKGLLALQLAQTAKEKKKKKTKKGKERRRSLSSSSTESSSSNTQSDSSEDTKGEAKGYAKAIRGYQTSGRRMKKHPVRHIRRYVRTVETELGAQDRPFKLSDYNRKIHFGKQQNLKRAHYLLSVILELILKEDLAQAGLQCVLVLQAMHQAALDSSWDVAWLLTHLEDPFKARQYGGDPTSLQHVTAYMRSMNELVRNTEALRRKGYSKGDEDSAATSSQKDGGKQKGRGKQKDKDKDKTQNTEN